MFKTYKYRLYPNQFQKELIWKHINVCRFVYNWSLEQKIKAYESEGKCLSYFDLTGMLPTLKVEHPWLKEVNSQSLQSATKNLDNAFKRFFREKKGFPKFKSKKNPVQSFQISQHYTVDFKRGILNVPKIKGIKIKLHRKFSGIMKTATISVTKTGKFFISILVDNGDPLPEKDKFTENTTIGIDLGLTHFATLSNGEKIDNPKHFKKSESRIKVLHRRVSRKKRGSNNRKKSILKLAKVYEKVANQRRDFLHKLSSKIVSENQAIAIENLNVSGMLKDHKLAKHISGASWYEFRRQLTYKCE